MGEKVPHVRVCPEWIPGFPQGLWWTRGGIVFAPLTYNFLLSVSVTSKLIEKNIMYNWWITNCQLFSVLYLFFNLECPRHSLIF